MENLQFITINDVETGRQSSLSFNGKRDIPGTLRIVGGLNHNSVITFTRDEAEKMVKFLQENILSCYEKES